MPRGAPELWAVVEELRRRLGHLDIGRLRGNPAYVKEYLQHKLEIFESSIARSVSQLTLALSGQDPSDVVLIDHGGGLGFTGLLAKLAGARVVYNDIDASFLELAREIAGEMDATADLYVLGDWPSLMERLEQERVHPTALISYDVIEHIADMEAFVDRLRETPWRPFSVVMSSGANMFSPRYLAYVIPIQLRKEREWRKRRRAIAQAAAPDLPEAVLDTIAARSRKFQRSEIESALRKLQASGRWSDEDLSETNRFDPYGTNTVNPDTGWWAEHLMHPWRLRELLAAAGFATEIRLGLYGRPRSRWKARIASMANWAVERLGAPGITIAAYYTLVGRRDRSKV